MAAERVPGAESAFTFPLFPGAALTVQDDGVEVTSAAYAATRRLDQPLRLAARDLGGADWATGPGDYGVAAIDRGRGRLRFFAGHGGPVQLVRRVRLPHGKPIGLARRGQYLLFMTDSNLSGLLVADVSDPARPRVVATADKEGAWTTAMSLGGNVVFAAVSGLLYAWDVSDPLRPAQLPTLRCGARDLAVHGTTLYFVKGKAELGTVGVSRPRAMKVGGGLVVQEADRIAAPRFLGRRMLVPGWVRRETLERGGASEWKSVALPLAEGPGAPPEPDPVPVVYVFDVAEGRRPQPVARWVGGPLVLTAQLHGKPVALLRAWGGGLAFVDSAEPSAPQVVAIASELKGSVVIEGGRLYLARRNPWLQDGGFFVYDVADLARPRLLGKCIEADRRWMEERSDWQVHFVEGRYAYVADPMYGILIFDVGDASRPHIVGGLPEAGLWRCVAVTDERVFLGGDPGGLAVLDSREPEKAGRVGSFMAGPAWGLAGRGTVAFVANGEGLRIVETADAAGPVELSSVGGIAGALAVTVRGGLAFVAGGGGYGDVLDIRDLRRPRRLGRFHTRKARGLDTADGLLYVADAEEGLVVFDVRDPQHPQRIGHLAHKDGFRFVCVRGTRAFLRRGRGLAVADVSDPRHPRLLADTDEGVGGPVAGDFAYAHAFYGEHNLLITDVRDPARPTLAARYDTGRYSYGTDCGFHRGLVYLTSLADLSILRVPASSQAPTGRVTLRPAAGP